VYWINSRDTVDGPAEKLDDAAAHDVAQCNSVRFSARGFMQASDLHSAGRGTVMPHRVASSGPTNSLLLR
jgi:hypothetical protein